jgi:hypothetical protein
MERTIRGKISVSRVAGWYMVAVLLNFLIYC